MYENCLPKGSHVLVSICLLLLAGASALPAGDAVLASAALRPPTTLDVRLDPGLRQISDDGRFVVFTSEVPFVPEDSNGDRDVYLLDRERGDVRLVSRARGIGAVAGNAASDAPVISADGSTAVFRSWATDLVHATDENEDADVFHWDRATGKTTLISHRFDSQTTTGDRGSGREVPHWTSTFLSPRFSPALSADGSVVVFRSRAEDLVDGTDVDAGPDLFVWDRGSGEISLVSRTHGDRLAAERRESSSPSISADGRWVAFTSNGSDLVSLRTIRRNVYLWDRLTGEMILVSSSAEEADQDGNGDSLMPAISADGSTVAFASWAENIVVGDDDRSGSDIFLWQRESGETTLVSSRVQADDGSGQFDFYYPSISADGAVVAYNMERRTVTDSWESRIDSTSIFVWSETAEEQIRLSDPGRDVGKRIAASRRPSVSADGELVAFPEGDLDLYLEERPNEEPQVEPVSDVWLWERSGGEKRRISSSLDDGEIPGNGPSHTPLLSADGKTLAFVSRASDLIGAPRSGLHVAELETGVLISPEPEGSPLPSLTRSGGADEVSVSADGRWVAFTSSVPHLVEGTDTNGAQDVYLLDRSTGDVTLVSHAWDDPSQAPEEPSRLSSFDPMISADGRSVVFASTAWGLVQRPEGTDDRRQTAVYLWNRSTGQTTLVSHSVAGPTSYPDSNSFSPVISADGSAVAFASGATDLIDGHDENRFESDVFLWERSTGEILLVSHVPGDPERTPRLGRSRSPVISADGTVIAFESASEELVDGLEGVFLSNVFVFDRETGEIELVFEVPPSNEGWIRNSFSPSLSDDGRFVAYADYAVDASRSEESQEAVYLLDRSTGAQILVSHAEDDLERRAGDEIVDVAISADGSLVAFSSPATDMVDADYPRTPRYDGAVINAFAWEREGGEITLLSRSSDGSTAGNHHSRYPKVSADGSRVIFSSEASNLGSEGDANGFASDIFRWQRASDELELVSHAVGRLDESANSESGAARMSSDGKTVAFLSRATDLVTGLDANGSEIDVFVHSEEPSAADLRLHGEEGASSPGEVVWNLEVENRGPAEAHRLVFLHQLPEDTEFLDAVGEGWDCLHETGVLSCRHGRLETPERTATLSLRWLDPEGGGEAGKAAVEWPGRDPEPVDNRWPRSLGEIEDELSAHRWLLVSLGGEPPPARRSWLRFQERSPAPDTLRGFSGCNVFWGAFDVVGSRLEAAVGLRSRRACLGAAGEQEEALFELLESGPAVRLEDGDLVLQPDTGLTARYAPSSADD